jgi:RNA 3'-terminal phosphate cyclase (ATP)
LPFIVKICLFQHLFRTILNNLYLHKGLDYEIELKRRGFYPKGGGEVFVRTKPIQQLKSIELTNFGDLKRIYGRAYVAGFLGLDVAQRMADTASKLLRNKYQHIPIEIEVIKEKEGTYYGVGSGIIVIAETSTGCLLAGSGLGEKGVSSEDVAKEAAESLMGDLDCQCCVDHYMQDQLIIFMALAEGVSRIRTNELTLHTKTAIHYTQVLTGVKFDIKPQNDNRSFIIECNGMGFSNNFL